MFGESSLNIFLSSIFLSSLLASELCPFGDEPVWQIVLDAHAADDSAADSRAEAQRAGNSRAGLCQVDARKSGTDGASFQLAGKPDRERVQALTERVVGDGKQNLPGG